MKKLAIALSLVAGPAMAHPGHPVLPGPEGHVIAHVALVAGAAVVAYLALELGRIVARNRKG